MKRLDQVLDNQQDNYIMPFFWQHGESEEVLREYMKAIYDSNIQAVCVESRPHPDFCGPKWWQDMDVILDEASKKGMKVWILDDSHFPTGFANGAVKKAPDELCHQYMVYRSLEIAGPIPDAEISVKEFMESEPLPPWIPKKPVERVFTDDELVAVLACKVEEDEKLGEVINLTSRIQGDRLTFSLNNGYWKIFVVYLTRNAEGRNDYINFLDKDSCKLLLDAVYEPHYAHYKDYFGNTIAGFFSDEPPVGNTPGYIPSGRMGNPKQVLPWSRAAAGRLTESFGSRDWADSLPFLWAEAVDGCAQAKIRGAYMDMVSRLVEECFSRQNGNWCHDHGVEYIGHMLEDCDMNADLGPSMGHFFRGLNGQHMAGIDNIGGQVMIGAGNSMRHANAAASDEGGFYHYLLGKLGASHAAIDPKKQGRCLCENFGAYGWQSGTKEQKYMMDHFMARGVNRFVPHAFTPAPFPDPDCPPHFYAHGENPLYRGFGELMAYTNRVCHLIDGGKACPDVALLYHGESRWAGENVSNIQAARELTQAQIDFHVIPADVFAQRDVYLTESTDGCFSVNGNFYSALVISGCRFLDRKAAEFAAEASFPIYFTERRPEGIIGMSKEESAGLLEILQNIPVIPRRELGKAVKERLHPQAEVAIPFPNLTTYHYQNGGDLFILFNEDGGNVFKGEVALKAKGTPVRYYPWENRLEQAAETEEKKQGSKEKSEQEGKEDSKKEENYTRIFLKIQPLELAIIVIEKEKRKDVPTTVILEENAKEITEFRVSKMKSRVYLDAGKTSGEFVPAEGILTEGGSNERTPVDEVLAEGILTEKGSTDRTSVEEVSAEGILSEEVSVKEAPVESWEKVSAPFTGMQQAYPDFSGYYLYETKVPLDKGSYQLEIEDVYECAEVFVDGSSKGTRLQKPFAFRFEQKEEKNVTIRIEVATLLERQLHKEGHAINGMSPFRPLSPTGILGTVNIRKISRA